jgi:hypothetical protein
MMKRIRSLVYCVGLSSMLVALNGVTGRAATVSYFGLGKAERYSQTSEAAPVLASDDTYVFKGFAVPNSAGSLLFAMVPAPGSLIPRGLSGDNVLTLEDTYSEKATFDSSFPTGVYSLSMVTLSGSEEAKLTLGTGTFPNIPQVASFSSTQGIDPTKSLTLTWNAFEGGTSGDFIQLTVMDKDDNVVFQTAWPGQPGVLDGTARTVTIPANSLSAGKNTAILSFTKVTSRDTTALTGATGLTTYARDTVFTLLAGSGGSTGGDNTPPLLVSSTPANMATGVSTNSAVVFTFNEAMAPTQEIMWNGLGLDDANFLYHWSTDGRTLTCTYTGGLPPNTMIIWALEPSGFKDLDGNELASDEAGGFFRTASGQSGTSNPCDGSSNDWRGAFTVYKFLNYVQTSAAAPVLDGEGACTFMASLTSPDTNPVVQASLVLPNGTTKSLTNFFGSGYSLSDEFLTKEALDAAYPAGAYQVNLKRSTGATVTLTVNLSAAADPPVPQLANFDAVQKFDPASDFTLRWNLFTGATANSHIALSLHDMTGKTFTAPDPCVPRLLAVTDTSIVVPKNTFSSSSSVSGSLSFSVLSTIDTNTVRDFVQMAGASKATNFKVGQSSTGQLLIQSFGREASGSVHFQVKATAGSTLVVEASTDLVSWAPISTSVVTSGVMEFKDSDAANYARRYYRVRTLF